MALHRGDLVVADRRDVDDELLGEIDARLLAFANLAGVGVRPRPQSDQYSHAFSAGIEQPLIDDNGGDTSQITQRVEDRGLPGERQRDRCFDGCFAGIDHRATVAGRLRAGRRRRAGICHNRAMTAPPIDNSLDVWEAMSTARTMRRFSDQTVDDEVLARCLEAATWAPSGGNQQPWRFVVIKGAQARQTMALGAARAFELIKTTYGLCLPEADDTSPRARTTRATFELHEGAGEVPAAVLFCVKEQPLTAPLMLGGSIFPAMQNFLLAARAMGLGTCVTGWHVAADAEYRTTFAIPDDWYLAAVVVVGHPLGKHGPVRRRSVNEVAVVDRWDQPFPI